MDSRYELLLDVQNQKCYTCQNYRRCNVLNADVSCDYKVSEKARREIKGVAGFFGVALDV